MISNLNEIPFDWKKIKFGSFAKNITDRIDIPKNSGLEYYIGLEHLDTDEIRIKRIGFTKDVKATKFLCKKGDIIFGKRNAYLRKVSVTDRDAVVSAHSMVIRPIDGKIYSKFLPCLMQSSLFWKTAYAISEGSMSPTIKWKLLSKQEFWLPTDYEQKRIASILWSIEDTIEKNEKLVQIFNKYRIGLLEELIVNGFGNNSKIVKNEEKIKESKEIVNLSEITKKITKGTTPTTYGYKFVDKGVNFIKVESIDETGDFIISMFDHIEPETHKILKRSILEKDDILFSIAGALGRVAIVPNDILPANTNQAIGIIRLKDQEIIKPEFLKLYLTSNIVKNYVNRRNVKTAQANLNLKMLSNIPIIISDINTQNRIVSLEKEISNYIDLLNQNLINLKKLKVKLTNSFINGDLLVK